ncbi:hypothetical protein BDQ12DRAFT_727183 [Crucibulum laeve]|uniref:Uncharacterized protein n=1 Tax=Crucibulum laeve TaxID=68775 RepID=A0A5C3LZD3_9AGAR|nr:hypothetical protein BDQ12DRAFT_727183 [Crucibulum laeve]
MATTSTNPVVLYTQGTPNGHPISVLLEELKFKATYNGPNYEMNFYPLNSRVYILCTK